MTKLTLAFLKIFFRNRSTVFFVIFLPAMIFVVLVFLGRNHIVNLDLPGRMDDFLLAGLLAFALMQAGVYTTGYTLLDYRRRLILKRLSVSPLSGGTFLRAQVMARFCIALLQTVVLLSLGVWVFHTKVILTAVFLPVVIFFGCVIYLNIGFLIASVARDYEQAAIYTSMIGLVSSFLGDVFFPADRLSGFLVTIANFLPLRPLSVLLRFLLSGGNGSGILSAMLVLLTWFAGTTVLANYIFIKKAYR